MSDVTTIARPYAKAAFEIALSEEKLTLWSDCLYVLAQAVLLQEASKFINNPNSTVEQHVDILQSVINPKAKKDKNINNLIEVLAHSKRLMVLPEIYVLFEALRQTHEKTLEVDVLSFSNLSASQQKTLIASLSKRLERKVALKISVDPTLIGGAIVQAGDLVIDGSVRGKLNKLATELTA